MKPDLVDRPWHLDDNPTGLTELEVSSGMVLGDDSVGSSGFGGGPGPGAGADPLVTLRHLARRVLATPPCVVAFSGGRDSSALLAVLADEARRQGMSPPVAVTSRWDDDEASNETNWQEDVIRAVGVTEWEIIRPGEDLDLLGPEAAATLEQTGLMWPPPAYALQPMIRLARGGVFLSGEGGDEAFGLWPHGTFWSALRGRRVPRRSDVRAMALACAPRFYRRRHWQREMPPYQDWLRQDALRRVARSLADDQSGDPLRWDRYQLVQQGRRAVALTQQTLEGLCGLAGASFTAPFLDERFLRTLAAWGGWLGRGGRTEAMTALFSDLLPGAVLGRETKASFGGVFWGPASRHFAETWDGSGLNDSIVDAEALRRAWLAPLPVYGSALPLHAAWLYARRERQSAAPG